MYSRSSHSTAQGPYGRRAVRTAAFCTKGEDVAYWRHYYNDDDDDDDDSNDDDNEDFKTKTC